MAGRLNPLSFIIIALTFHPILCYITQQGELSTKPLADDDASIHSLQPRGRHEDEAPLKIFCRYSSYGSFPVLEGERHEVNLWVYSDKPISPARCSRLWQKLVLYRMTRLHLLAWADPPSYDHDSWTGATSCRIPYEARDIHWLFDALECIDPGVLFEDDEGAPGVWYDNGVRKCHSVSTKQHAPNNLDDSRR